MRFYEKKSLVNLYINRYSEYLRDSLALVSNETY